MEYEVIIGLEIHCELKTASKMFCSCSADYASAPPNTHTCPVCLGMPGMLPTANRAAIEAAVRTGLALHCTIPPLSKFDRKNYTYPDLPKGYQISQYDLPFCVQGFLDVETSLGQRRIRIRRVHLEEDTAKLMHAEGGSLIDFNRAGVPLMEIVTEADIRTAEEAYEYLVRLRTLLRYLGVSTGNMEEGAMRCEVNLSLRPVGVEALGTKVEVKNLNSFRSVRLSIAYEIERQTALLERGERVQQVTMGWDEEHHRTVYQRSKESSEDYRYFPEPDLPPLALDAEAVEALRATLPELPEAKRVRYGTELGVKPEDAALLAADRDVAAYFEEAVAAGQPDVSPQTIANWMVTEVFRHLREAAVEPVALRARPGDLVALLRLVAEGAITQAVAKDVLAEMLATGVAPAEIVARRGLRQISDADALRAIVAQAVAANPGPLRQYLEGKTSVLAFFIGQVMRATKGQGNPALVRQLVEQELGRHRTAG